jgi:hypothetical protein
MTYRAKLDAWLVALAVATASVLIAGGVVPLLRRGLWGQAALVLGVIFLVGVLNCPLYYRVTDRELIVRSGIQCWRIPLAGIVGVRPTSDLVASPALSLDRLAVDYTANGRVQSILISPEDQDGFLFDLAMRVRELRPFGFGLARPEYVRVWGARTAEGR